MKQFVIHCECKLWFTRCRRCLIRFFQLCDISPGSREAWRKNVKYNFFSDKKPQHRLSNSGALWVLKSRFHCLRTEPSQVLPCSGQWFVKLEGQSIRRGKAAFRFENVAHFSVTCLARPPLGKFLGKCRWAHVRIQRVNPWESSSKRALLPPCAAPRLDVWKCSRCCERIRPGQSPAAHIMREPQNVQTQFWFGVGVQKHS